MTDILQNIFSPKFLLVWFCISFIYVKVSFWFNPDGDSWLLSNRVFNRGGSGGGLNSTRDSDVAHLRYGSKSDNVWFFAFGLIGLIVKIAIIGLFIYMVMFG